jgi:mono/diheme cytochrome c family protein
MAPSNPGIRACIISTDIVPADLDRARFVVAWRAEEDPSMEGRPVRVLVVVAVMLGVGACKARPPAGAPPAPAPTDELAVTPPAMLDQGWDAATREAFWFTPQGAEVMPYRWFLYLERPDSETLLRGPANMERYRYIPMPRSRLNPDGLPLGFTHDTDAETGQDFLGLTCAACHTAELKLGGKSVLIDGGPTLADFKTFLHELNDALAATLRDNAKFTRFSSRVLAGQAGDAAKLRADVQGWADTLQAREKNDHTTSPYGFARLDAFGAIINNVATADLNIPENAASPDAPVSYPFIWDAPFADRVQWNGAALNVAVIGPLLRNVGEVLGVFGRLDIRPAKTLALNKGYANSVNLENLGHIENLLKELWSPAWPAQYLPAIDAARAARGAKVYEQRCVSCHTRLDPRDPARSFKAVMTPVGEIGTDPKMGRNYLDRRAKTGVLAGNPIMIVAGPKLAAETRSFEIVVNGVTGVILRHPLRALKVGVADWRRTNELRKLGPPAEVAAEDEAKAMLSLKQRLEQYVAELRQPFDATSFAYKARPLNGVWATAPYLHNGSVPSLWALLQPAASRPRKFYVGSRDFDPRQVGLASDKTDGSFELDVSVPGNSNQGHEYGTDLPDDDKWSLVEYLKTL